MSAALVGHVDIVSHGLLAGWAADRSRPLTKVTLTVAVNGLSAQFSAEQPRTDLKSVFENATGEYGFRFSDSPLPLSPFIENRIEIRFADDGAIVPGGEITLPPLGTRLPQAGRAGLTTPILVTTTGRSGSSLLMARLAQHPAILVARDHPHELKLLSYYALALNTLVSGADRERSTNADNMLATKRYFVGFNPYNDETQRHDPVFQSFWTESSPDILRACFVALIDAYYARRTGRAGKPHARFFAEKIGTAELARHAASFMFGTVNEIMLVRDPRDIACSARSFWQRSFDRSIVVLRNGFKTMSRPRAEPGRRHILRYEDLVLKPHDAMRDVCAFLGIEYLPSLLGSGEGRVFQAHGTSVSPEQSIGRWRRELSAENIAIANRAFAPFLRRYGYDAA